MMRKISGIAGCIGIAAVLIGCESLYEDDGIPRIRTQADVAAYNATVSSESEQLVCSREQVLGTNLRRFVCLTVAQRERLQVLAQDDVRRLFEAGQRVRDPNQ